MAEFKAEQSSNVGWARYEESTRVLEIDFKTKGEKSSTYAYDNFSPELWEEFKAAESKGKFFAYRIRLAKDDAGNLLFKGRKL